MHTVTLLLMNSGTGYTLNFNREVDAKRCVKETEGDDGWVEIKDDFGLKASIRRDQIVCRQIADIEAVFEGQGIAALIQARAQAKLNQKAQADPTLRFLSGAAPNGGGGSIIIAPGSKAQ